MKQNSGNGRIMVVDDTLANRKLAEAHLMAAGYEVTLAENGEKAIALFRERNYDLVLLDILMPQMNGFEACAMLRTMPQGKITPIVFLTALADLETHERAMASGADDFLTKPMNRTELLIRVRSLIRVKHLNDELQQAQRQKDELVALIVHDLKSPLTGILGNADLLATVDEAEIDIKSCAHDIYQSAETMHRMVLNILDVSRSEDGRLVVRKNPVDLRTLVDNVAAGFERRAQERGQTLSKDIASLPAIAADGDLLERVLHNLLDNATKYAPKRGHIFVEAHLAGENGGGGSPHVEIAISDDGPGIPAQYREKVFDKYVQLEHGGAPHARSSRGLGLTFCKLAVEAHGGHIAAEDRAPRGTTFRVELPLA